jgi:RimJ/RimL family protein N-acetyltransferase
MANLPPASFSIQTENFVLRPMLREDASPAMAAWTEDDIVVEMLNTARRRWAVADQIAYFSRYDGERTQFLLGIFPNGQKEPVGFFIIKLRPHDSLMLVTHFLGDTEWRGKGASREASIAIFEYFFDKLSYAKAKANVRPNNKAMQWLLRNGGWRVEARLQKHLRMKSTGERSDLLVFGILADEWRAKRESAKTVRKSRDVPKVVVR